MRQLEMFEEREDKMTVKLLSYTPNALDLLLTTKNTRLSTDEDVSQWDEAKKLEHLSYMRDTIKSSWEFVDYVFEVSGVTRAFTHQLVRTRTGSYAQQAMRVVDARNQPVIMPPSVAADPAAAEIWEEAVSNSLDKYGELIDMGVPVQDARGELPTNISTNIIAKYNLRTLHEMGQLRLCTRTQGEYQDVFRAMRELVVGVHPWAEDFIQVHCVTNGTCAFPRYGATECPVYSAAMDNTAVREEAKKRFWSVRHEAAPVVKNGKAQ